MMYSILLHLNVNEKLDLYVRARYTPCPKGFIYIYIHICRFVGVYKYIFVCRCVCRCVSVCVGVCVCVSVCVSVCVCVCVMKAQSSKMVDWIIYGESLYSNIIFYVATWPFSQATAPNAGFKL